jgi:hypothetical protein
MTKQLTCFAIVLLIPWLLYQNVSWLEGVTNDASLESPSTLSRTPAGMKVTLETSGGFAPLPALSRPITIDTSSDRETASELHKLLRESTFFELGPFIDTTARGAADYLTYQITVEDGSRVHTVRFTEPIPNPSLQRLLIFIQKLARPAKQ